MMILKRLLLKQLAPRAKRVAGLPQFLILVSALPALLTGCATGRIADYHPTAPAATERLAQKSGVEITLDPFVEKERTEKYFDLNAVGNGIAVLHVRVTNKTTNQTFLVEKKNLRLMPIGAGNAMAGDGKEIKRSTTGAETLTVIGVVGIGLGGLATGPGGIILVLAGAAMESNSTEIQRNFVDKEMPDQTLSPGESMEGFVYFTPVKKGEDWSRTTMVNVSLTETMTHQVTELNIPLSN